MSLYFQNHKHIKNLSNINIYSNEDEIESIFEFVNDGLDQIDLSSQN